MTFYLLSHSTPLYPSRAILPKEHRLTFHPLRLHWQSHRASAPRVPNRGLPVRPYSMRWGLNNAEELTNVLHICTLHSTYMHACHIG